MFPWQRFSDVKNTALRLGNGEVLSWSALNGVIEQRIHQLKQQGILASFGIALWGKNSFDFLCFYLAGLQLGCRVLGVNSAFPQDKVWSICEDNAIDLLIDLRDVFQPQFHTISHQSGSEKYAQGLTLTLTSGSTGHPKAVVHTMAAHLENASGVCQLVRFQADCAWLLSLPLYHVSGQGIVWRWLATGAELHLPSDDFYLSVMQSTHVSLVPTQLQRFLAYLQNRPQQAYRTKHILLGGTNIPVTLTEKLPHFGITSYSGYGMTEMASTVFAKVSNGQVGVGQILLGRECQLKDCEIWVRGAGLGLGYWQKGKIVPFTNAQGWYQTKDKGEYREGELVILGRLDNMFISGGENIQPEEVELVLLRHSQVEQVFVLPTEDAEFGQRPVAMVAFSADFSAVLVSELTHWLADKIEKFKQPIAYYPLDLKKYQSSGSIKISRTLLKQELSSLICQCEMNK